MKTYKFKLYNSKRNKKLHRQINIAGSIYNHCIALHRRYYRIFKKSLPAFSLSKHLTKLKRLPRYSYWKLVGSQAIQDISERISRAYALFFRNLKHNIKTAPPCFKKIRKYKSFTFTSSNSRCCQGRLCRCICICYYDVLCSRLCRLSIDSDLPAI